MSDPLPIEVSALAATQVRAAETWWQLNRRLEILAFWHASRGTHPKI